jgi:hypothetical protein
MDYSKTNRGFGLITFTDTNGVKASVQESSSAEEANLWLGVASAKTDAQIMTKFRGWVPYDIPEDVLLHDRLHLNEGQVTDLIKVLQYWVDNGYLPETSE